MKNLTKNVNGSDWGRFVWKDIPEGYKANAEQSVQKDAYEGLLNKTKKSLEKLKGETILEEKILEGISVNEEFKTNVVLSTQIANMLKESGSWGKMADFLQTKFVMKALTKMGWKINNPRDFAGKKLVIENCEVKIETLGTDTTTDARIDAETKKETSTTDTNTETQEEVMDAEKEEETTPSSTDTKLGAPASLEDEISVKKDEIQRAKDTIEEFKDTDRGNLASKILEQYEKDLVKLEAASAKQEELKEKGVAGEEKTPPKGTEKVTPKPPKAAEVIIKNLEDPFLQDKKEQVDNANANKQTFDSTNTALPTMEKEALDANEILKERNGDKEKLIDSLLEKDEETGEPKYKGFKDYTRDQVWEKLQNKRKHNDLLEINGLMDYDTAAEVAAKTASELLATQKIQDLYVKYNHAGVLKLKDISEEGKPKTDFEKLMAVTTEAIEKVEKSQRESLKNYSIYQDLLNGQTKLGHVSDAKYAMDTTLKNDMETPNEENFPVIAVVRNAVTAGRKYGPVNELLGGEEEMLKFLEKDRRITHMKEKQEVIALHEALTENDFPAPEDFIETDLDNKVAMGRITDLSTFTRAQAFNEKKDKNNSKTSKWKTKYLPQSTSDEIEAYIGRVNQLETAQEFLELYHDLPGKMLSLRAAQRTWDAEELKQYEEMEGVLDRLADAYFVVGGAELVKEDLVRMDGGEELLKEIDLIRDNSKMMYQKRKPLGVDSKFQVESGEIIIPEPSAAAAPASTSNEDIQKGPVKQESILKAGQKEVVDLQKESVPKSVSFDTVPHMDSKEEHIQNIISDSPEMFEYSTRTGMTSRFEIWKSERIGDELKITLNGEEFEYQIGALDAAGKAMLTKIEK